MMRLYRWARPLSAPAYPFSSPSKSRTSTPIALANRRSIERRGPGGLAYLSPRFLRA